MNTVIEDARIVTHRLCWTALRVGGKYRTIDHTIHQVDLARRTASRGPSLLQAAVLAHPFVPPELTYRIMEDVIARTFLHRAGPATIECAQCALPAVRIGDTIHAIVEIEEIQPDWTADQALVAMNVEVVTERGASVLSYTAAQWVEGGGVPGPARARPMHAPAGKVDVTRSARGANAPSESLTRQLARTAADRERPNGRLDTLVRVGGVS
jgi:hypothetical protein